MAKLKIKDEHGKERLHELIDDVTSIGRASSNTIQITDEKGSRQHFRVEKQGANFKVVDLGSTNGTKLNGVKISADIVLRVGDQLSVGKTTFTYEDEHKKPESKEVKPEDLALAGGETVAMDPVKPSEVKEPALAAVATAEAPKYVLKMLEGKTPGKVYELGAEALTIGRHNSNTIQIIDDAASNYHAEIGREPIGYVLTDLGSTNGTRVKLKNKTDFEKVVKTPLSVGMQIRVGKTLLEFDNFGKPVEDEALFGTVALDQDKLEQVLAPPPRHSSVQRAVAVAIVLVCVVALAGTIYKIEARPVEQPVGPPPTVATVDVSILNGDFEAGADDAGIPKNFAVARLPGAKPPGVTAEAQYRPEKGKLGLQVIKSGPKSLSTLTVVETAEAIAVDPTRTYEFSGAIKNDEAGLFGLRVTWIQGERSLTECPVVLGNQQPWIEKKCVLTPPLWAQKMKLGVFVQGNDGKACFDDLALKVGAAAPVRVPSISNGGVGLTFDSAKGLFEIASNGQNIVDGGTLLLLGPNADPWSDLSTARPASNNTDGEKTSVGGQVFDFVLQDWRPYLLEAQPGASGTDLAASVESSDNSSRTALRFYVVGEAAKGEIAVTAAAPDKVAANEDKTIQGVREILFNAGKTPQLDLMLADASEVEFKREGKRRRVTLYFQGKSTVSFASESVGQKKAAEQLMEDIKKAIGEKRWGDAEGKTKELTEKYAESVPAAKDEAARRAKQIDEEWRDTKNEIQEKIKSVTVVTNDETLTAAKNNLERHTNEWARSSHVDELKEFQKQLDGLRKQGADSQLEQVAEAKFNEIKPMAQNAGSKGVALMKLKFFFLNPDAAYAKTKAAEKAKALVGALERDVEQQKALDDINTHLINISNPFVEARSYQQAIDVVEKDPAYKDNKDNLPDIAKKLEEWKSKIKK